MTRGAQCLGWGLGLASLALALPARELTPALQDGAPFGLLWWPSGGLLAAALAGGAKLTFIGLLADFLVHFSRDAIAEQAALSACLDTAPALALASLLHRLELRAALTRSYDVALLTLVGAGGMAAAGATAVLLRFAFAGRPGVNPHLLLCAGLAHAGSVLLVTPALLVWTPQRRRAPRSWPQLLEVLALAATLSFVAAHVAPLRRHSPLLDAPPAAFVFLPAFLWAATRFGQRGAVSAVGYVTAASLVLHAFVVAQGPPYLLATGAGLPGVLSLQVYWSLALTCGLLFGSVIEERRDAIRLRDDFLLVASHELKTPLTALMLGVENLERRMERERTASAVAYRRKLGSCHAQIDRLARLVDGLLDVSAISGHSLRLRRQYHDLSSVVYHAVADMRSMVEQTHCRVDCELDDNAWGFYDEHRVLQLMHVLLENACKYGAGKPILVTLRCHGDEVDLSVQDQGIGVPPQDVRRIFRRFERAVSAHSYGGLGLGLFVAHKIAAAHGGELKVDATVAHGARFVARLPRRDGRLARWLYARSALPAWLRQQL